MLVRSASEVKQDTIEQEGVVNVKIRWLISKPEGAPNFAMREFEIEPAGHTPFHSHDWEHEVYVLSGQGVVSGKEGDIPIKAGMSVFVAPGEEHNFKNTGKDTLKFICMVPHQ